MFKTSRPDVFCKKGVLRNFTKFTGKHLCQSLFFHKVAGLGPATLLKKRLWHRCFPVSFVKFLRTPLVATSECSGKIKCLIDVIKVISKYFPDFLSPVQVTLFPLFSR